MNGTSRASVLRLGFIHLALIVLAASGCGVWNDLFGEKQSDLVSHGSECTRNREELVAMLENPPACASTDACPAGAFCNSQKNKCDWNCLADSDCGFGKVCLCDGICADPRSLPDGGGQASDPACVKSLPIIYSLRPPDGGIPDVGPPPEGAVTGPRTCRFNDECPNGSHCDRDLGKCDYRCVADSECSEHGAGWVCGCAGRCTPPQGVDGGTLAAKLPELTVTPSNVLYGPVPMGQPERPATRVDLAITYPPLGVDEAIPNESDWPKIALEASLGVRVACTADAMGATFSTTCRPSLAVVADSDQLRAVFQVKVVDEAFPPGAPEDRYVRVTSAGTRNPLTVVTLTESVDQAEGPLWDRVNNSTVTLPVGGLRGIVNVTQNGLKYTLPVYARRNDEDGTSLYLFDQTRTLTPSGIVRVPIAGRGGPMTWFRAQYDRAQTNPAGSLDAAIVSAHIDRLRGQEDLRGGFEMVANVAVPLFLTDAKLVGEFFLKPDPKLQACTASSCPDGYRCAAAHGGFCLAGADDYAEGAPVETLPRLSISNPHGDAWINPSVKALIDLDYRFGASVLRETGPGMLCRDATAYQQKLEGDTSDRGIVGKVTGQGLQAGVEQTLRYSGDFWCAGAQHHFASPPRYAIWPAIPLIHHADDRKEYQDEASTLLQTCLQDLDVSPNPTRMPQGADRDPSPTEETAVRMGRYPKGFFGSGSCISLGNFYSGLYLLGNSGVTKEKALYLRLLQQWIELHNFIARQGAEERRLDVVLNSAVDTKDDDTSKAKATYEQLLDRVERGFILSLKELAGQGALPFQATPDDLALWARPDYREHWKESDVTVPSLEQAAHHEQYYGVAPLLAEGATSYLNLLRAYLDQVEVETYSASLSASSAERSKAEQYVAAARLAAGRDNALRRYGDAMRYVTVIEAITMGVYGLAGYSFTGIPWKPRFETALEELKTARARAVEAAVRMSQVRNPLGIEEDDLPLFFGDLMGTNSRFFASSDYLLTSWAIPAVTAAGTAMDRARDAWIAARNSHVQDEHQRADQERRMENLQVQYGSKVADNCGLKDIEGGDLFSAFDPATGRLSPATCHIDHSKQECLAMTDARRSTVANVLASKLTDKHARWNLCRMKKGQDVFTMPDGMRACILAMDINMLARWPKALVWTEGSTTKIKCPAAGSLEFDAAEFWSIDESPDHVQKWVDQFETQCSQLGIATEPLPELEMPSGCYRGRMGEAVKMIDSSRQEFEAGKRRVLAAQVSVSQKWAQCQQKISDAMAKQRMEQAIKKRKNGWLAKLSKGVSVLRQAAANPLGAIPGIVGGALETANADAQEKQEDSYRFMLQEHASNEGIRACLDEAHVLKIGIDTELAHMEARAADAERQVIAFNNYVVENVRLLNEGRAAMKREQNRPFGGFAHHYWYDEKVERFKREFEWAKRLTYLAMRAVEYEFQQSTPLRDRILGAFHPDQLDEALLFLKQEQAGRTINRRRPEESSVVLSLRDDVLRIADNSKAVTGERAWTPAVRFMDRMLDPVFAVRDDSGRWIGQGIPFSLDALAGGVLNAGALVNRCAERLWRVTATMQGDGLSAKDPSAGVFLLKRNTFESQWCQDKGDGSPAQSSSIQPSRQLFRPGETRDQSDESSGWSAALVYPWFNVRRSDFYKLQYREGASEELAGRGLYGDYLLLFPKEIVERGFPLNRVEDVLLRFDYLSVDNLPKVIAAPATRKTPSLLEGLR